MKSSSNLLERLKTLPFFSRETVLQLGRQLELSPASTTTYISRYLKSRDIISLKNGLYISNDFYVSHQQDVSYRYYLANILRTPSYVSSWAALQYYGLATETINTITSVTSKVGRSYETNVGTYSYQSMQKQLYKDFLLVKETFEFFIATPAKAVFDTVYFKTHQFRGLCTKDIPPLIEELRIDISEMKQEDMRQLFSKIKDYLHE